MSIQGISSPSFCGIKKVVSFVLPIKNKKLNSVSMSIQNGICKPLKSDTFVPSKKVKSKPLTKITQYFNKDKLVGVHIDYADGGYKGSREFADGTKISYNASNLGGGLFVAGTHIKNSKKGLIGAHISHDAYDKKGRPAVPTLKLIKALENPKNYKTVYEPCC